MRKARAASAVMTVLPEAGPLTLSSRSLIVLALKTHFVTFRFTSSSLSEMHHFDPHERL
jgi:hypothetical protein